MSTSLNLILTAQDQMTGTLTAVSNKLGTVDSKLKDVSHTSTQTNASMKSLAFGFSGIATAAFNLYNLYDRVVDAGVQVDRSNLNLKRSTETLDLATKAYNATILKFGIGSVEATDAADKLAIANDALTVAQERAGLAQEHQNELMVQSAIQIIPTVITMVSSVAMVMSNWTAMVGGLNSAMTFLAANPIVLVIAAITALIVGLIWAYNNCEEFRNVVNAIGEKLKWFWDNVLVPVGAFLVGTFLKAWQDLCNGWSWAYDHLLKPVFDALVWAYDNILKPIADFFAGIGASATSVANTVSSAVSTIGGTTTVVPKSGGAMPHGAEGGIIAQPTVMLAGEAGPEALIPLNQFSLGSEYNSTSIIYVTNKIEGPLINIQGDASRQTAARVASIVQETLKNITLTASSSAADETHKQIRVNNTVVSGASPSMSSFRPLHREQFRENY